MKKSVDLGNLLLGSYEGARSAVCPFVVRSLFVEREVQRVEVGESFRGKESVERVG